jgi:hypothetical protein
VLSLYSLEGILFLHSSAHLSNCRICSLHLLLFALDWVLYDCRSSFFTPPHHVISRSRPSSYMCLFLCLARRGGFAVASHRSNSLTGIACRRLSKDHIHQPFLSATSVRRKLIYRPRARAYVPPSSLWLPLGHVEGSRHDTLRPQIQDDNRRPSELTHDRHPSPFLDSYDDDEY